MIITTERLPIKIWTDDIEESALNQLKNLANLPFAFKHIAAMPDCHTGYGMPIGGVLATRGATRHEVVEYMSKFFDRCA